MTWTMATKDPATWPAENCDDTLVELVGGTRLNLCAFQVRIRCEDSTAIRWMPWPTDEQKSAGVAGAIPSRKDAIPETVSDLGAPPAPPAILATRGRAPG